MLVYAKTPLADPSALVDLGPPEGPGGKVLEGKPTIAARVDYQADGMMAGIFESTTGKIEVTFPFTEHATILEGEVKITDSTGKSHTYVPGDSYFIQQGEVVLWEVRAPRVRKSFFNITKK